MPGLTAPPIDATPAGRQQVVEIGHSCTACGACLITCPVKALRPAPRRPELDPGVCTGCLECVEVCPASAITPLVAPEEA